MERDARICPCVTFNQFLFTTGVTEPPDNSAPIVEANPMDGRMMELQ